MIISHLKFRVVINEKSKGSELWLRAACAVLPLWGFTPQCSFCVPGLCPSFVGPYSLVFFSLSAARSRAADSKAPELKKNTGEKSPIKEIEPGNSKRTPGSEAPQREDRAGSPEPQFTFMKRFKVRWQNKTLGGSSAPV